MEFGKRHDTTDTTDFCPRQLVTDLLWTCYGETDVVDFDLNTVTLSLASLLQEQPVTTVSRNNSIHPQQMRTRQLSYRKEDRAMRPIYGCPQNF